MVTAPSHPGASEPDARRSFQPAAGLFLDSERAANSGRASRMSTHPSRPVTPVTKAETAGWFRHGPWADSPLGPRESWPQPLITLTDLALGSKTPTLIVWGPELCMVYNHAYSRILGDRHPAALGRPLPDVWSEIWDAIQPLVYRSLAGEALYFENERFLIRRDGVEQEAWFNFSYTPVHDETGAVAGIYCALTETTNEVRAERDRADSFARLQQLFRQAPGFMAVTSGPGHMLELANESCMRLVGRTDLAGKRVSEAIPELADQVYLQLFDQVYATGEAFVGRRMPVHLQPPGERSPMLRYVDFVFQPITDSTGSVTGVFVQGTDVTEHHHLEDQLRHSEVQALDLALESEMHARRLDALLEAAPVGIIYADANGRLEVVNAAIRKMWGNHPDATDVSEYHRWKAWWADGSERDGQPVGPDEWPITRVLRGEEEVSAIIEIEPFGRPGERRTAQVHARPVRTHDGALVGAVVAEMDITDQVRMQARLRESEIRFRTITDVMPQIAWSTRPDGQHDYYNRRWYDYTGMPEGTIGDEPWHELVHPDDRDEALDTWRTSVATGDPYEIKYRLRHRSGEYRWVLGRALPVRNHDGQIVRWMGTCTDIHEQVLAQKLLEDASRRKDEFLAMLAHELRNPLAPISTAASVLAATPDDPKRVRQLGDVIRRQVGHMTRMVDELLDVSRVTRGLARLDCDVVDLATVARSAIEQIGPLIDERKHQLITHLPDGELLVMGDRIRLVQVVSNLLNNAAKYTRSGGRIELELAVDDGCAVIEVSDNGSGIEPELLPQVFELFTQGARGPDRSLGGLGIGLALAKSIVELHGGSIVANSAGRGRGSEFKVLLPLAELERAEPGTGRMPSRRAVDARLSTMVVDDNADAARTIALLLELQGHEVRVHHDATTALADSRAQPAQLYILDIGLPDMSGHELAQRLRQQPGAADAKLIAVTGYGRAEDRTLSEEAGFDLHLVKPVDAGQLLDAVATVGPK
ncbi:PAS domain S-box protein [Lysobacter korlensis]|uniref:histidine kinase n=1 Tax=Lysobacter korlensis TaxID=553636 RepID=A0ABV6RS89_9GAMM